MYIFGIVVIVMVLRNFFKDKLFVNTDQDILSLVALAFCMQKLNTQIILVLVLSKCEEKLFLERLHGLHFYTNMLMLLDLIYYFGQKLVCGIENN